MSERVRFAPSPTGFLHIGGLRTALYDYLVAKKTGGDFILRIEDTDRARFVEGAEEDILDVLQSVGLKPDEEPVRQSERLETYRKHADLLKEKGLAYDKEGALAFRMDDGGFTEYEDLIRGKIKFENRLEEDFIIIKSDGFPTYNFANVIDDHEMNISTVIRGEEFISSMPKHLSIYKALGWQPPRFAHLPLILGQDRKKLSKRTGDTAAQEYLAKGYLKEALLNFLVLLGWHPKGDEEILSLDEMISEFDLSRVQSSPAIFDIAKLDHLNKEWMKRLGRDELFARAEPFGLSAVDRKLGSDLLDLILERLVTLDQIKDLGYFLLEQDFLIPEDLHNEIDKELIRAASTSDIPAGDKFTAANLERWGRDLSKELNVSPGKLFMSLRITVLGRKVSPPLFESMALLGEEKVKERLLAVH